MNRFFIFLILFLFIVGCNNAAVTPALPTQANLPPPATITALPLPSPTLESPTSTPTIESEPTITVIPPLAAEAQRFQFQTEDGVTLVGYYYPAAVNPAPLIVLMHWAGGDQTDWLYVGMVSWLQNRNTPIPPAPDTKLFDTPYRFAPLPAEFSFAIFTFDFRGYGESQGQPDQPKHILDARAAYQFAARLEGVDPQQVIGIGASIGADAAVDGCENCIGALSLGPGNWLGVPYAQSVKVMDDVKKPAWCVATEEDPLDVETCNSAAGTLYQKQIYPRGGHAMRLFRAENNLNPEIGQYIWDYIRKVYNLP